MSQKKGAENIEAFRAWCRQREAAEDWHNYLHNGQLNRRAIAAECGFGRSAFVQNEGLKIALAKQETDLSSRGVASTPEKPTSSQSALPNKKQLRELQQQVQRLESRVATLAAENAELRLKLRQASAVADELVLDGKRLHPHGLIE